MIPRGYEKHHGQLGISVRRGYRDQGIGYEIMMTDLDEARKVGLLLIGLTVSSTNPRAIHLYENVGFKRVGVLPKKLLRGGRFTDEVSMSLEL
jgi:RimJ/RimL family protein N-acetyltransferase